MNNEAKKQQDELLFETLGKNKKRRRRRIIITVISVAVVLALAVTGAVTVLRQQVQQRFAANEANVLSHTAQTGTISTLVSGAGVLQDVDPEDIRVPQGVEILEVLVKRNDTVKAGDVLATVDAGSVISAMADRQAELEELDGQLSDAEDDKVSANVKAGVSGRVKAIYGEKGTAVTDTMYQHGALAILSTDGFMAVQVQTDRVSAGDSVTVVLSDGSEKEGVVDACSLGTATILISDNGPLLGDGVTVRLEEQTLGTGELYVHSPIRITGYAGTVSAVKVKENQKVSASATLFTLTDRAYSANYETLLRQRQEVEEVLLELLSIQKNGAVLAPVSGSVLTENYDETSAPLEVVTLSRDAQMYVTFTVDEGDILSLEAGQEASVTVSSVAQEPFTGTVTEIDRSINNDAGAYTAKVTFAKEAGMLSGMTADVDVKIRGVADAVLVPVDAVNLTSTGAYVYTAYDPKTQTYGGRTDVVVGLNDGSYYEIKEGLQAGQTVYYTKTESIFSFFSNMAGNMGGGMGNMGGGMGNMGGGNFDRGDFAGGGEFTMPQGMQPPGRQ